MYVIPPKSNVNTVTIKPKACDRSVVLKRMTAFSKHKTAAAATAANETYMRCSTNKSAVGITDEVIESTIKGARMQKPATGDFVRKRKTPTAIKQSVRKIQTDWD